MNYSSLNRSQCGFCFLLYIAQPWLNLYVSIIDSKQKHLNSDYVELSVTLIAIQNYNRLHESHFKPFTKPHFIVSFI